MFQHLQWRPAPPPPAPAGAAVRSERKLLKNTQNRSKIAQNHSKPLKTAQNRSESLRIAQIRFKLTQNHENPVNLESFWATYSRFCLRSRDQHSNICSNICRIGCQHVNINSCNNPIQHFNTSLAGEELPRRGRPTRASENAVAASNGHLPSLGGGGSEHAFLPCDYDT